MPRYAKSPSRPKRLAAENSPTKPALPSLLFSSPSSVVKYNFYIWELRYGGLLRVILVSFSREAPAWVDFRSRLP